MEENYKRLHERLAEHEEELKHKLDKVEKATAEHEKNTAVRSMRSGASWIRLGVVVRGLHGWERNGR